MKYRHFHGNSSQRYHRLRTDPENYFVILDEYLGQGDRAIASPQALAEYEGHRCEDRLMAAISHYIKDERAAGRRALAAVSIPAMLRARRVQHWRLTLLTLGMWVFLRLPRVEWLAQRMLERWHVKRPPKLAATTGAP